MSDPNQPGSGDPAEQPTTPPAAPPQYPAAAPAYETPQYPAAAPAYETPQYPAAAPAYGAPAQYPGAAPQYPAYAPGPRMNVLAIVSFISSLVGVILIPFIGQIVGVITGHISLGQIKRSGENGRGFALAGVIIGWASLGLFILLLILIFAVFVPIAIMQGTHGLNS